MSNSIVATMKRQALILTAVVCATAGIARADVAIAFVGGTGGSIAYDGAGHLIGSNIDISYVTATGVASHAGQFDSVTNGALNFNVNVTGVTLNNGVYTYNYDGTGSSFTVTGAIPTAGIANSPLVYNGTFSKGSFDIGNFTGALFKASGSDSKNPVLLSYYGVASDTPFTFNQMSLSFNVSGVNAVTKAFTSLVVGSTVVNSPTPAPEPASMMMIGGGLLVVAVLLRRSKTTQPTHKL